MRLLTQFKDTKDGYCLILGTGESSGLAGDVLIDWTDTCSVNDFTGLHWPTDYLVCCDKLSSFNDERKEHVKKADAKYAFTHIINDDVLKFDKAEKVIFMVDYSRGNSNLYVHCLDTSYSSIFMAAQVMYHLGYKKIGILGADLLPGTHHLCDRRPEMIKHWKDLAYKMEQNGVELINLSSKKDSVLQKLKQMTYKNFENSAKKYKGISIKKK